MKEPTFFVELREQLDRLAPNSRAQELLVRHVCDGHTIAEISKAERMSSQTVSITIAKQLKFLRHPARVALVKDFWTGRDPSRLSSYGALSKAPRSSEPVKNSPNPLKVKSLPEVAWWVSISDLPCIAFARDEPTAIHNALLAYASGEFSDSREALEASYVIRDSCFTYAPCNLRILCKRAPKYDSFPLRCNWAWKESYVQKYLRKTTRAPFRKTG